ncbi:MAG: NAD(P)-dependent oxidoreductase [Candidatus Latescibacterota bacterium]
MAAVVPGRAPPCRTLLLGAPAPYGPRVRRPARHLLPPWAARGPAAACHRYILRQPRCGSDRALRRGRALCGAISRTERHLHEERYMARKKTASRARVQQDVRIGFVGVGRMGANMARRLKEQGYPITAVYDVERRRAAALARELDCAAPRSLAEVTSAADVVVTVVSDDRAMNQIFAQRGDSLLQGAAGRVFINCATITPAVHVEVEKRARDARAASLEACMASSIPQARQGTLYLMCGGRRPVFERVEPILRAMSAQLRYVGESGRAAQVKALVNMVMNINTAGLAEGLGLGRALGLDLGMLMEVFAQTGAASRVLETDGVDMVSREHECYFSAAHAAKDSGIAYRLSRQAGLTLPMARAARGQFERLVRLGLGELDKSGVAELTFPGRGPTRRRATGSRTARNGAASGARTRKRTRATPGSQRARTSGKSRTRARRTAPRQA